MASLHAPPGEDLDDRAVETVESGTDEERVIDLRSEEASGSVVASVPVVTRYERHRRPKVVGALFALTALVATAVLVDTVVRARQTTFGGVVAADNMVVLDFSDSGTVGRVEVTPGAHVRAGQVLADLVQHPMLMAVVEDDRAALSADRSSLIQLEQLLAATPTGPAAAAGVTQAQQSLTAAQGALQAAVAQAAQQVTAAQQAATQSNQRLIADEATALSVCSAPTSGPKPAASLGCLSARQAVTFAQTSLNAAKAVVSMTQTAAKAPPVQATAAVKAAQTQLLAAQHAVGPGPATTAAAQVGSTKAGVARDQAQLVKDQLAEQGAELRAPFSGTVTAVNGAAGALAGPAGVRLMGLQNSSTSVAPALSLLPVSGSSAAPSGSSSVVLQPVIELSTTAPSQIVVQVPESKLVRVVESRAATISIAAIGIRGNSGHFVRVDGGPRQVNGAVVFDAVFALSGPPPPDLIPGLSADVTVQGHKTSR